MTYVLKNMKTGMYFEGYEDGVCNKPTWTKAKAKAITYNLDLATRMTKRLLCQSQYVKLAPSFTP